jgi:hypothetical protein
VVEQRMDVASWLRKQAKQASRDLLRAMAGVRGVLMGAEAEALCSAGYGEHSSGRVNVRDGYRERDVASSEHGTAWLASLRSLVACGLAGIRLVASDAHPGSSTRAPPRCPARAASAAAPRHAQPPGCRRVCSASSATMVRSIYTQPDTAWVHERHARIVAQFEGRFPETAAPLD